MKNILLISTIAGVMFGSCTKLNDFLDKEPYSNQSYVSTIDDCALLLTYHDMIGGMTHSMFMDDGIAYAKPSELFVTDDEYWNEYTYWSKNKYLYTAAQDDPGWNNLYHNIYYANVVLNRIDKVDGDDDIMRKQIKGEAYLYRAFYHFILVNLYSKQYNPATAAQDPGIPYVMDIDTQGKRVRGTVQGVYDRILSDLEDAESLMSVQKPEKGKNWRGSLIGAYCILAKVYLHLQNWEKSVEYAEKALQIKNTLVDYNDYPDYASYMQSDEYQVYKNSDEVFLRGFVSGQQYGATIAFLFGVQLGSGGLYLTPEVADYIDVDNDLRYRLFMGINASNGKITIKNKRLYVMMDNNDASVGGSLPETHLVLAEAYLRNDEPVKAVSALNNFMKYRYDASTFVPFSSSDKVAILAEIRKEKTIEQVYTGNRWFEMRRLNTLGEYSTVVTRTDDQGNVIGTLVPSPARMVVPIPGKVTDINPDITPNPFE